MAQHPYLISKTRPAMESGPWKSSSRSTSGYPPKTLAEIFRFQWFYKRLAVGRPFEAVKEDTHVELTRFRGHADPLGRSMEYATKQACISAGVAPADS